MRLVVCDDHGMFRDALAGALRHLGHDVVGTTGELGEVVRLVEALEPETCLLDLWFGDEPSLEVARALRLRSPEVHVVLLTADAAPEAVAALDRGDVRAIAHKTWSLSVVDETLTRVAAGLPTRRLVPLPTSQDRSGLPLLTERELDVLRLVAEGATTAEIRCALGISEHTVRSHIRNLLHKLGAHSRIEAVRRAHAHGLVGTAR